MNVLLDNDKAVDGFLISETILFFGSDDNLHWHVVSLIAFVVQRKKAAKDWRPIFVS